MTRHHISRALSRALVLTLSRRPSRLATEGARPGGFASRMMSQLPPDDPLPTSPWGGPHRRGLRLRKKDDSGVRLFRAAIERLHDLPALTRALVELGRIYDPVRNGPLVTPAERRRILELASHGAHDEARQAIEAVLAEYTRREDGSGSSPP
jgi:hypothetical protein